MTEFLSRAEIEFLSGWILDEVRRGGASGGDVFYSEGAGSGLTLKDGEIDRSTTGFSAGLGIRTMMSDGRQGISYGNRLDKASLRGLVDWSLFNCRNSEPEEGIRLYEGKLISDPELVAEDPEIALIDHQKRMKFCGELTERAKEADGRVVSVRGASWNDFRGVTYYRASTGAEGWERGNFVSCSLAVIANDGDDTEMGGYGVESKRLDEISIEQIALKAVKKTVSALGGAPIKTGTYTLIIDPETASALLEAAGDLFCSSEIHKGRSLMKDRIGTKVASYHVNLTDDGRIPWKMGSSSWDSEGVPTGRTVLIKEGIAESYLYNLQYAWRDGVESTGNACRSMSSLPDVGTTNLVLEPGTASPESLISATGIGLYVTELMGVHTIDPISGDFSIGAKGHLIDNGELTVPVSGVTIASNLTDFLNNIVAVGSDQIFFGSTAASTLVVENIVIAGK